MYMYIYAHKLNVCGFQNYSAFISCQIECKPVTSHDWMEFNIYLVVGKLLLYMFQKVTCFCHWFHNWNMYTSYKFIHTHTHIYISIYRATKSKLTGAGYIEQATVTMIPHCICIWDEAIYFQNTPFHP